jgi:hypothetical protein
MENIMDPGKNNDKVFVKGELEKYCKDSIPSPISEFNFTPPQISSSIG